MRIAVVMVVVAVWVVGAIWLPTRAGAQSGMDVSRAVPVHPDVATVLQLPDEITDVWSIGGDAVMVKGVGAELYLRPRPDTPAGVEVFIEVQTRTLHRIFLLRVVERAADATPRLVVPPQASAECAAECAVVSPAAPDTTPAPAEPPVTAALSAPDHAPAESGTPPAEPVPEAPAAEPVLARDVEPATERAAAAARSLPFELSIHALAGLGTTALDVPGYAPTNARQSHRALSMRFTGSRPGSWWAVEANIGAEWLVAPTLHTMGADHEVSTSGMLLQADGGLRARVGARLAATLYTGIGLQAHLLDRDFAGPPGSGNERWEHMPFGGVLALGVGLEYWAGDLLLGVELHVRQGVPDDYRSVRASLSVGFFLDQENEP